MIDTIVVATDGSESVRRCLDVSFDLANRFDADLHALYVQKDGQLPDKVFEDVQNRTSTALTTATRQGDPAEAITEYATDVNADIVATGTRGRHGEHRFLLGSVAETVVRSCPIPVLTVRQLAD